MTSEGIILFLFRNFTLTLLVVGLVFSAVALARAAKTLDRSSAMSRELRKVL